MKFKAIIFDFDGIITDTEPIHMKAWLTVLRPLGLSFTKKEYDSYYLGLNDRDFLDRLGPRSKIKFNKRAKGRLIRQKLRITLATLEKNIPAIPAAVRFIKRASKRHLLAVCSGANKREVLYVLRKKGLIDLFDPIITQEDVKFGKPNPQGYKLAIRRLMKKNPTLSAKDCLAIEDSPKGIAAAHAAGIKCLAVTNSYPKRMLKNADWIKKSLSEFDFSRQRKKMHV